MCGRKIPVVCDKCGKFYGCGNGQICSACPEHADCSFKQLLPEHRCRPYMKTCPDCLATLIPSSAKSVTAGVHPALSPT